MRHLLITLSAIMAIGCSEYIGAAKETARDAHHAVLRKAQERDARIATENRQREEIRRQEKRMLETKGMTCKQRARYDGIPDTLCKKGRVIDFDQFLE